MRSGSSGFLCIRLPLLYERGEVSYMYSYVCSYGPSLSLIGGYSSYERVAYRAGRCGNSLRLLKVTYMLAYSP